MEKRLLIFCFVLVTSGAALEAGQRTSAPSVPIVQDPKPAPKSPGPQSSDTRSTDEANEPDQKLVWPRDQNRVLAKVAGKDLTLGDLIEHMTERHDPTMRALVETDAGARLLRSPQPPRWARQFADVIALKEEARAQKIPSATIEKALSDALGTGFRSYLEFYLDQRRQQGLVGDLPQSSIDKLMARFQSDYGLEWERQGYLELLTADEPGEGQLQTFFTDNARMFGGNVTLAHILIHHRDPKTGELMLGAARQQAIAKVADVRTRLKEDGSNFEEVAILMSDDRRTGPTGGIFRNVARFDPRLPAEICRAAWGLPDGAFTGPIESPYGMHFVKRLSIEQVTFMLYTEQAKPRIRELFKFKRQEDLLFDLRARLPVEIGF